MPKYWLSVEPDCVCSDEEVIDFIKAQLDAHVIKSSWTCFATCVSCGHVRKVESIKDGHTHGFEVTGHVDTHQSLTGRQADWHA